jgi:hypothetical protein
MVRWRIICDTSVAVTTACITMSGGAEGGDGSAGRLESSLRWQVTLQKFVADSQSVGCFGGRTGCSRTLSEIAGRRPRSSACSSRRRAKRTFREAEGAAASFIDAVGDLPLDEITRAEMLAFCRVEGARTIGGKTPGSIVRPVSAGTLKKKVGLLRSAINHAIATDNFAGPNPAAQIDARRSTRPVPKEKMPDKRPFTVHELQPLVHHPWFTGCVSATNIQAPGRHRLVGCISGCRSWPCSPAAVPAR